MNNSWQLDSAENELEAFGSKRRKSNAKAYFWGLVALGALTFVGAYYFPLYRAHEVLAERHDQAAKHSAKYKTEAEQLREKLNQVELKQTALLARESLSEAERKNLAKDLEGLKESAVSVFGKAGFGANAAAGLKERAVSAKIADSQLFGPKLSIQRKAGSALCELAKSAKGSLKISIASFSEDSVPAQFAADFPSAWEFSAAKAAKIARHLSESCHVPSSQISAAGAGQPGVKDAALPPARVELEFAPPNHP